MNILGLIKTTLLDYPEHTACIVFTGGCNFRCHYCHNFELINTDSSIISENEIIDFLIKRKNVLEGVVISGGEPCIHHDLPKFIKKIKALGFMVKLDTNGSYPEMLKLLINEKLLDYIAMDIKAPLNTESLKKIVHTNAVEPEKIKASIDLIMHSRIEYEFRTTIAKELLSLENLLEIAKYIKNAKRYYLQSFKLSDNVPNKKLTAYSDRELNDILIKLRGINPNTYLR